MMFIPLSIFPWLLTAVGIFSICSGDIGAGIGMTLIGAAWLGIKFFLKSSENQNG